MFGKFYLACGSIIAFCSNGLVAATQLSPRVFISVPSPHMTTATQKSVEQIGTEELEGICLQNPAEFDQCIQQLSELCTRMQAAKAHIERIQFEISGLITQFSDQVMGADITSSDTFLSDITGKLTAISREFFHEPSPLRSSLVKKIMKNSGELKYALCVAVAWANKLSSGAQKLEELNQLYKGILEQDPSKDQAIALVRSNAINWEVFAEDFLTFIEE